MSQTGTPVGTADHRDAVPVDRGWPGEDSAPVDHHRARRGRPRWVSLIAGTLVGLLAAVFLGSGGWALWTDRITRDGSGFVPIGTNDLRTDSYAIVGDLHGDGPRWLYGSTVLGDARIRVRPQSGEPIFVGIGRTADIRRYLDGVGHATIERLASGTLSTREGGAPAEPPTELGIWQATTTGTTQRTLLWEPRSGDWSVLVMNTDATAGVAVRGGVAAKVPPLPWLAGALLLVGAALAVFAAVLLVYALRRTTFERQPGRR